jgi:hypothetical protein
MTVFLWDEFQMLATAASIRRAFVSKGWQKVCSIGCQIAERRITRGGIFITSPTLELYSITTRKTTITASFGIGEWCFKPVKQHIFPASSFSGWEIREGVFYIPACFIYCLKRDFVLGYSIRILRPNRIQAPFIFWDIFALWSIHSLIGSHLRHVWVWPIPRPTGTPFQLYRGTGERSPWHWIDCMSCSKQWSMCMRCQSSGKCDEFWITISTCSSSCWE